MKWLKCAGELRIKELEKSRSEFHDHFEKMEKEFPECTIPTKVKIGVLTRQVCTLSISSAAAHSQQFHV
jgi:hypothetical protein